METGFYPRFVEQVVLRKLKSSPAVLLHGPRQCGKTTLTQEIGDEGGYEYFTLDDRETREQAETDPAGFVDRCPRRTVLDEVQKAPDLLSAIKIAVDRDRRTGKRASGRFLLTGSTQVLLLPQLSDSLAGRMQKVRLHPLSRCELQGRDSGFLDALFGGEFRPQRLDPLGPELLSHVITGGYPEVQKMEARTRAAWYADYLDAQIERDLRDLAGLRKSRLLSPLLKYTAAQTAGLFYASRLSGSLAISQPTVSDYVEWLERAFMLQLLPAWRKDPVLRMIKTPKIHVTDTGLACALLEIDAARLEADRTMFGPLLETFVLQELCRQASWRSWKLTFSHFRDRNGMEVDIVLEQGIHRLAGIEVKAGSAVTAHDFRGLRRLRAVAGKRFAAGVVLYDGTLCKRIGSDLYAVPLRLLWEMPLSQPASGQMELDAE